MSLGLALCLEIISGDSPKQVTTFGQNSVLNMD